METASATPATPEPGIRFEISEDATKLVAVYQPGGKRIDAPTLRSLIKRQGYDDWFIIDSAVADLIERFNTTSAPGSLVIGEQRDGKIEVQISRDKMEVMLTLTPPAGGGRPVTREQVLETLREKGVLFGIMEEVIDKALEKGEVERELVAQGMPPVNGEDTQFVKLLEEVKERCPKIDDSGAIDYRELGDLYMVEPGTPLMRRVSATEGTAGTNVLGQPVPPKPGKEMYYWPKLTGVRRAKEDQEVLVADIIGQPVLVDFGMIVDPTLHLETVDLASGNVHFEGSVKVDGDVQVGMKIVATGDVYVGGVVEAATIEAGGDVVVKAGIIGHGDLWDEDGEISRSAAIIKAEGSAAASFVENAQVIAKGDILVRELVSHSDLDAGEKVVVGKRGAKRGSLVGGKTRAGVAVKALTIGSPLGIVTKITVGEIGDVDRQLQKLLVLLDEKETQREKLIGLWKKLQSGQQPVDEKILEKAKLTMENLNREVVRVGHEVNILRAKVDRASKAQIIIGTQMHSNVHVTVKDKSKRIKDERGGGAFYLDGYDLVFGFKRF